MKRLSGPAEKSITGASAWGRFFNELLSDLRVSHDGEDLSLDEALSRLGPQGRPELCRLKPECLAERGRTAEALEVMQGNGGQGGSATADPATLNTTALALYEEHGFERHHAYVNLRRPPG